MVTVPLKKSAVCLLFVRSQLFVYFYIKSAVCFLLYQISCLFTFISWFYPGLQGQKVLPDTFFQKIVKIEKRGKIRKCNFSMFDNFCSPKRGQIKQKGVFAFSINKRKMLFLHTQRCVKPGLICSSEAEKSRLPVEVISFLKQFC